MYKFANVKLNYLNDNPTYWYLYIDNMLDLFKYLEIVSKFHIETYFDIKKRKKADHFVGIKENCIAALFYNNNNNRKTLVDDINHISDNVSKPKIKMIMEGKTLLVGENLIGFMPLSKDCEILEIIEKEHLVFPQQNLDRKDIRVIQWSNGEHYYAKIGDLDVVVDGVQKWDSREEAEKNAELYLKELI